MRLFAFVLVIFGSIFIFSNCNKFDSFETGDVNIGISTDTVLFDTIFTNIGSATLQFKINNTYNKKVLINSIHVGNPQSSFFMLNVDGDEGRNLTDIEVYPNDSLFVFVNVKVDPTNQNNPVVINDSITIEVGGNKQIVKLIAFGQDVHLLNREHIENRTWINDKPYLIYDTVWVDESETLIIEKGVTVYAHKNAWLLIAGNINVKGTVEEPVTFRGDRLDEIYEGYEYDYSTSLWSGIAIAPSSRKNTFANCTIKNAVVGLYLGNLKKPEMVDLELKNTTIHNCSYSGILSFNSKILAKNCQITNNGVNNLFLVSGGDYNFYQSTIANYFGYDPGTKRTESGQNADNPSLVVTNSVLIASYEDNNLIYTRYSNNITNANFYNCIVDGSFKNEILTSPYPGYTFNFNLENCLVKAIKDSLKSDAQNSIRETIFNQDSIFRKIERWNYNFEPDSLSPARNKANIDIIKQQGDLDFDLKGNYRFEDGNPDIGALEYKYVADTTKVKK